ncbi:MAG: recombination protein RecR [Candidatus Parcubacteria bacterium]|nr:MAG: recombination protein RecR [Candidatus Parcubacteria bacterium]
MLIPLFKKIIEFFDSFPEIGPRQAMRLFFWLVKQDKETKNKFLENLKVLFENVNFCQNCFFPTTEKLCLICSNPKRKDEIIALVARETDVLSLETAKVFKGKYFILGGLILPFEDKGLIKERLKILEKRLEDGKIEEVIVALPYTREAEPTLKHLEILRKKFPQVKFSFLAKGIPLGGEIEFIDPETLKEAIEKRISP